MSDVLTAQKTDLDTAAPRPCDPDSSSSLLLSEQVLRERRGYQDNAGVGIAIDTAGVENEAVASGSASPAVLGEDFGCSLTDYGSLDPLAIENVPLSPLLVTATPATLPLAPEFADASPANVPSQAASAQSRLPQRPASLSLSPQPANAPSATASVPPRAANARGSSQGQPGSADTAAGRAEALKASRQERNRRSAARSNERRRRALEAMRLEIAQAKAKVLALQRREAEVRKLNQQLKEDAAKRWIQVASSSGPMPYIVFL